MTDQKYIEFISAIESKDFSKTVILDFDPNNLTKSLVDKYKTVDSMFEKFDGGLGLYIRYKNSDTGKWYKYVDLNLWDSYFSVYQEIIYCEADGYYILNPSEYSPKLLLEYHPL
jgi:hypothetical protein